MKDYLAIAAFGAVLCVALPSLAKHSNPAASFDYSETHTVVHIPTGCMARIETVGLTLRAAAIIDPDCLPSGVQSRAVPGSLNDFTPAQAAR